MWLKNYLIHDYHIDLEETCITFNAHKVYMTLIILLLRIKYIYIFKLNKTNTHGVNLIINAFK